MHVEKGSLLSSLLSSVQRQRDRRRAARSAQLTRIVDGGGVEGPVKKDLSSPFFSLHFTDRETDTATPPRRPAAPPHRCDGDLVEDAVPNYLSCNIEPTANCHNNNHNRSNLETFGARRSSLGSRQLLGRKNKQTRKRSSHDERGAYTCTKHTAPRDGQCRCPRPHRQAPFAALRSTFPQCATVHRTVNRTHRSDETLARRMTFNRSQRRSCSATYDTPSRNQVVYESFGAWRPTVVLCERRSERVALQDSSGDPRNRCRAEDRAGSRPPKNRRGPPAQESYTLSRPKPHAQQYRRAQGGILT